VRCFVVAGFLLTSASRGPSAIAEPLVNFGCPIHISGMAEARALKLCTKGNYLKSGQRDDKSPLKGAWFAQVTHFYHATVMLSAVYAVVVCLCVCLSYSDIVSKRLNVGSHKQRHTTAP